MTNDRSLLERCLYELEQPGEGRPALLAALRRRLSRSDLESRGTDADIVVDAPSDQRARDTGTTPVEGANTLWDTNQSIKPE